MGFYRNIASKHVYAAKVNDSPLKTDSNARMMRNVKGQVHTTSIRDFNDKHEKVLGGEAKLWWDEEFAKASEIELVVQVNGKVRSKIMVPAGLQDDTIKETALGDQKVKDFIGGKKTRKVIVVKGKLVNIVI